MDPVEVVLNSLALGALLGLLVVAAVVVSAHVRLWLLRRQGRFK